MSFLKNIFAPKSEPKHTVRPKVGIFVGHSRIGDKGAYSVAGVSEWDYNVKVASALARKLRLRGIDPTVVDHYPRKSYGAAIRWLASFTRKQDLDVVIELHFNAASASAEGYEYLHWHNSTEGVSLALSLLTAQKLAKPYRANRGTKPIKRGRGSYFLRKMPVPAVICEPFFGSNRDEWQEYGHDVDTVASIYCEGLTKYFNK